MPEEVKRWDPDANAIFNRRVENHEIYETKDPVLLDRWNAQYFSEYCNLANKQKRYTARKRLRDKIRQYFLGVANNIPRGRPDDDDDEDDDILDPIIDPPSPPAPAAAPAPPSPPPRAPSPPSLDEVTNALNHLTMEMATYSTEVKLPWLCGTTNFLPNGDKEIVFDFLAFPIGTSKYIVKVSPDGKSFSYSMYLPNEFYRPDRNLHPGTESSMAATLSEARRKHPFMDSGLPSDPVSIKLPFACESRVRSVEIIFDLQTDPELYNFIVGDDSFPEGTQHQVPLVLRVVLVGVEKCLARDVGRNTRVFNNAFSPPPGARTPPRADPYADPYAAFGGRANYEAFREYERNRWRDREEEGTQRRRGRGYVPMETSSESSGDWHRHTHSRRQHSWEQREEEEDPTARRTSYSDPPRRSSDPPMSNEKL